MRPCMVHALALAVTVCWCQFSAVGRAAPPRPIDRHALVTRHDPCFRSVDPTSPLSVGNRHHVFYQYDPEGKTKRVHWGHLYSRDLVHWQDLPPALYPDTERHCYSGQTLVEDDRVIAIYHGKESGNAIATASDPLLLNWKKHPDNPVIPNPDAD